MSESPRAAEVNLFLTHFHWDHIQGLPFFAPLIQGGTRVRFHAGVEPCETRARLERQMSDPFFTLDFNAAKAEREYLKMGSAALQCGALTVEAFPLNHPQGAWGYQIASGGTLVVVATDLEHGHAALDELLRERAAKADLLIYDAQYTDAEYEKRVGWGHSTANAAAAVAADADVKELLLFHHDPEHDDETMDGIVAETRTRFAHTNAAQEGATIFLG
jgi:phosphoribosyl 1,2-cyclic phosphodiesterase